MGFIKNLLKRRVDYKPGAFPVLEGEYLGQKKPGLIPEIFAPGIISTKTGREFGVTFSPNGNEFYFARSGGPTKLKRFTIMVTRKVNNQWTEPKIAFFSGKDSDFEPFITSDGKRLYFGSMRQLTKDGFSDRIRQWALESTEKGWSRPKPLGFPFSNRLVMHPTQTKDGTIYFRGQEAEGVFMLYLSKQIAGKYQKPEILSKKTINMFPHIAQPFVAADESYLIFSAGQDRRTFDLYISFKKADGTWTKAKNMGDKINRDGAESCPYVTPDGKYLFFCKDFDIYWVDAKVIDDFRGE